jgi:hypothetical protein
MNKATLAMLTVCPHVESPRATSLRGAKGVSLEVEPEVDGVRVPATCSLLPPPRATAVHASDAVWLQCQFSQTVVKVEPTHFLNPFLRSS